MKRRGREDPRKTKKKSERPSKFNTSCDLFSVQHHDLFLFSGSVKESKSSKGTPKTPKTPKSSEKKEEPKDKESVKEKKEASKEKKNKESSKNK